MPANQGQSESLPTGAYFNSSNWEMNSLQTPFRSLNSILFACFINQLYRYRAINKNTGHGL
jgi:hypothetical protein